MSKNNAIIVIVVIIVLAIGGYFLFANKASAPTTPEAATTTATAATSTGAPVAAAADMTVAVTNTPVETSKVVTYTDSGFSPKTFTVKEGTTVRFTNNSSHGMWVAVGNHPTHTLYDGTTETSHCSNGTDTTGTFDECKAVDPGTVYSFTFNKAGTFPFHNHVQASDSGTVTVTQ